MEIHTPRNTGILGGFVSVEISKNEIIIHDIEEAQTILCLNLVKVEDILLQTYGDNKILLSKAELYVLIAALQAMHDKMVAE